MNRGTITWVVVGYVQVVPESHKAIFMAAHKDPTQNSLFLRSFSLILGQKSDMRTIRSCLHGGAWCWAMQLGVVRSVLENKHCSLCSGTHAKWYQSLSV